MEYFINRDNGELAADSGNVYMTSCSLRKSEIQISALGLQLGIF
jgi:hypothetical protein